ncbi:hypothetical protein PtrV1_08706 [Pyrenophora tritici-repentis]|uniref:Uncharacterized protein n=1 Tax=Pyrenophora tritici-repentis TaxID=45151 RepID=A0A5M9LAQ1_9PLEO|nr:hypothetical protein PtrV1_08706 [Pyrenophora tritici-repentis]KAF7570126.1 hypothetical protein PtrM4_101280 [Pyrenophora tritici-repentis]KAI0588933.1 hypothetical protein Alg215_00597 [Pyrenophora tritici-repentis]KAI0613339.1 hypothetical protein TUN205_02399 [Pyrenophora tritici-repentis]
MAPKMPAPPSVKNKSRPAGGLYERAIAMQQEQLDKYQMQNSNNLQTELQTIIDRVVRELNVTKKDLVMTNRVLESVTEELREAKIAKKRPRMNLRRSKKPSSRPMRTLQPWRES